MMRCLEVNMARRRTSQNTLSAYWSKKERDLMYSYPGSAVDGRLVHSVMGCLRARLDYSQERPTPVYDPSFVDELEKRGYDITTLRFSVMLKETP